MANMNIADWLPDDVAEWMSGLGPVVEQYIPLFRARGVHGKKLLQLRCDDLDTLGMRCIGHQEILLEAVEHLRHFHYEAKRECLQQVAMRVATSAEALVRSLSYDENPRLSTQTLADVAAFLKQLKPLACWLERCVSSEAWLGSQVRAALLRLGLEAATCAQRDRFAEQPARAVAAAAGNAAVLATHILRDVTDSAILAPAAITSLTLPLSGRALAFNPGPRHLTLREGDDILQVGSRCVIGWSGRSIARMCVSRGGGSAGGAGGAGGAVPRLTLRRAPAPGASQPCTRDLRRELCRLRASSGRHTSSGSSSDESEPLSPPASPEHHTKRMFAPRPLRALQRRHTISGAPPQHPLHQFWRDLKNQKLLEYTSSTHDATNCDSLYRRDKAVSYSTGLELTPRPNTCLGVDFNHPILQRLMPKSPEGTQKARTKKLDKSQSTPAYDFNNSVDEPGPIVTQIIPESPTTPHDSPLIFVHSAEKAEQILDFKKCSTVLEEAIMQQQKKSDDESTNFTFGKIDEEDSQVIETLNIAMIKSKEANRLSLYKPQPETPLKTFSKNEHMKNIQNEIVQSIGEKFMVQNDFPPEPPPRPSLTLPHKPIIREPNSDQKLPIQEYPSLKIVRTLDNEKDHLHSPLKPIKLTDASQISLPIRHITKHDIRVVSNDRRELPALNSELQLSLPESPSTGSIVKSPTHGSSRSLFPTVKSLKKKNTLLAKRRQVSYSRAVREASAVGVLCVRTARRGGGVAPASGGGGGVAPASGSGGGVASVWRPRHAVLAGAALRLYRDPQCARALILFVISGATAAAAPEVRSKEHAFKIYRGARTIYLAADSGDDMARWIKTIQAQAQVDPHSTWGSEAEYSASNSSDDGDDSSQSSKYNSLKKLTNRVSSSSEQLSSSSLDRKYFRIIYKYMNKDDSKQKESKKQKEESKKNKSPIPTLHYRSYRRIPNSTSDVPNSPSPASQTAPQSPTSPDGNKITKKKRDPPKPINYIHASNPNLLDFEKTDFVTKTMKLVAPPKVAACDNFAGCVTLKEFMLQKQREERQELYSNRVLLGIERDSRETTKEESKKNHKDLQKEWDRIIPDIIYGELPTSSEQPVPQIQRRSLPKTPERKENKKILEGVPISVTGKDGYEKIIYTVGDKSPKTGDEPPKILPKKPAERIVPPEIARKTSLSTAKELGYELLYDDKDDIKLSSSLREVKRPVPLPERRSSEGKPVPPPKSQLALNRQNSLTGKSGVDTNPVFLQGESPEKFWLNSLKKQDKAPPPAPARPPPPPATSVTRLRHVFTPNQPQACQEPPPWNEQQYPHLQCPPVFRPETYSLRRRED